MSSTHASLQPLHKRTATAKSLLSTTHIPAVDERKRPWWQTGKSSLGVLLFECTCSSTHMLSRAKHIHVNARRLMYSTCCIDQTKSFALRIVNPFMRHTHIHTLHDITQGTMSRAPCAGSQSHPVLLCEQMQVSHPVSHCEPPSVTTR